MEQMIRPACSTVNGRPPLLLERVLDGLIERHRLPFGPGSRELLLAQCLSGCSLVPLGGPADEAGLRGASFEEARGDAELARPGDVIFSIDGRAVQSADGLASLLAETGKRVGEVVRLEVVREGKVLEMSVRLRAGDESLIGAI